MTKATPIPTKSREVLATRSMGRCERCGGMASEYHHRRSRSVRDEHVHCACNAAHLCGTCHRWAHAHPRDARDSGWIVVRTGNPSKEPITLAWGPSQPNCEGGWDE